MSSRCTTEPLAGARRVYRYVQRLLQKEQVNYDQGGYYHVYRPTDPDLIADEMQRLLNDWYAKMGQLIQEFRTKYEAETEKLVSGKAD